VSDENDPLLDALAERVAREPMFLGLALAALSRGAEAFEAACKARMDASQSSALLAAISVSRFEKSSRQSRAAARIIVERGRLRANAGHAAPVEKQLVALVDEFDVEHPGEARAHYDVLRVGTRGVP
jgi:hypothetical protein